MPLYQFLRAVVMAVPGTQAVEPLAFLLLLLSELLVVLGYLAGTVSSGVGYDRYHHDEMAAICLRPSAPSSGRSANSAPFGKLRRKLRPHSGNGAQQAVPLPPYRALAQHIPQPAVQVFQFLLRPLYVGADAVADGRPGRFLSATGISTI